MSKAFWESCEDVGLVASCGRGYATYSEVVRQEYAAFERENKTRPKFRVFPEVITVYKYANNADTTSTFYDHTFEESGRFKTQSITPAIPRGALCMTYFVKLTLSKYVCGVLYKG